MPEEATMALTKGARTRQHIVEACAPVFNQRGYAGASMRDLVAATGIEKGGIYNHFDSKEALAIAAFDHATARVGDRLTAARESETDSVAQLTAVIRAFATFVRRPVVPGGCPIVNTAVEADDTNPELREHARRAMTDWHRLIGSIVKHGVAAGELDPATDARAVASVVTSSLEGALVLSRLYEDAAHMDRVVEHLVHHVEGLRHTRRRARRARR
jgi:AcrR family transcriptional regulator